MPVPTDLGIIKAYAGDPLDITLTLTNLTYSGQTFRAQAKPKSNNIAVQFEVTKTESNGSTTVVLHLDGDSAYNSNNGVTRRLGKTALFEVQRVSTSTGELIRTMFTGTLQILADVVGS